MAIDLRPATRGKTVQVFHYALPQTSLCGEAALEQFARLRDNLRRRSWSRGVTESLQARERLRSFPGFAGLQEPGAFFKCDQPRVAGRSHRPVPPAAAMGVAASLATAWSNASTMGRNTRSASSMYWADVAPMARVRRPTTKP